MVQIGQTVARLWALTIPHPDKSRKLTELATQDIIEGVHHDKINQLTLHVKDSGCKLSSNPDITGKTVPANVDCNANNNGNVGCSYAETAAASYGKAFNDAGELCLVSDARLVTCF
jgi:hypothetical protein